ncbi:hypothetical protein L3085_10920 [Bacillus subtilis]|nr:hypothetical protein [Bacillus subtilis]
MKSVRAFSIYVNATGSEPVNGTIYLDNIRVSSSGKTDFTDIPASH